MILEEIVPGIDIDKDMSSKMNFMPTMGSVKEMDEDERIFNDGKMGIRDDILDILNLDHQN